MADRHVAAEHAGRDHAGKVYRVLRAAELGRVAQLGFLQVIDRGSHLEQAGQGADALVDAVLAQRLGAEQAAIGLAKQHLHRNRLRARIITGVGVRKQVNLLVVLIAEPLQRFFTGAGPGCGAFEQADNDRSLRAAEARVAAGDHVRDNAPLPVRGAGQRHQAPLACHDIPDFDRVAGGENVRLAGAHLLVGADAAKFPNLEPSLLCQRRVGPHTEAEHHDIRQVHGTRLGMDFQRAGVRLPELGGPVIQHDVDAMMLQVTFDHARHLPIQRAQYLVPHLQQRHVESSVGQVFRHLQPDKSAAHDHRPGLGPDGLDAGIAVHSG